MKRQKIKFPGAVKVYFEICDELGTWIRRGKTKNFVTLSGRDFIHGQAYTSSGLATNGMNWVGLSNDPLTETVASTTLSSEIVANGCARAQGVVAHTSGTNITTVTYTFTCNTASQSFQKAALFSLSSGGVMCHVVNLGSIITLLPSQTFQITFVIQLG